MASRTSVSTRLIDGGRTPVSFPGRAELEVPLTNTLDCINGQGGISLTRASVATFTDFEGVLRTALSGEIRFQGARRVENLASYSEDASHSSWIKSRATVTSNSVVDPDGKLVADTIVGDGTGPSYFYKGFSFVNGNKYIFSACFKAANSSIVSITSFTQTGLCSFNLSTGTAGTPTGIASNPGIQSLGNGWYRCSVLFTANATGSNNVGFVNANYLGDICYICRMQGEDVTGQSDTSVGEYVSTNVVGGSWKGSGVDSVKYFETRLDGSKIPYTTLDGVVIEGARTNLIVQSNNFSVTWAKNAPQLVITPNAAIGPDGAMSMTKLSPGAGAALQSVVATVTTTAGVHSYTVYARAGENRFMQFLTDGTLSAGYVNFDLLTGTVGASSLWTGIIEPVDGFPGLYRCIAITDTLVAITAGVHIHQVSSATTGRAGNISGDGVSGIYVYGAQLELGAFPSSYIPTTTLTVTRPTDVLSYNVMNAISNYGAVYLEYKMGFVPSVGMDRRALALTANTVNRFQLVATAPTTNRTSISVGNGTIVMGTDLAIAMSTGSYSKVAAKWVNGGVANLFQNGSKSTNLASPSVAVTQIDIGTAGGNPIFGCIKNLKVWKNPPTDAELQAITTL